MLALSEGAAQERAEGAVQRFLEAAPMLFDRGDAGLPAIMELLQRESAGGGHHALLWSDGIRARLVFSGDHRIVFIREHRASLIRPGVQHGHAHFDLDLIPGDMLVVIAHSTQAHLPLGTVAAMAREDPDPQSLCVRATAFAAEKDPLSHHAGTALSIFPGSFA
jgi:hypothetical protein